MSEQVPAPVPETPAAPAPVSIGALDSLADYRKARSEGLTEIIDLAAPAPEAPAPVAETPEQEAESQKPDTDVSEAARTLRRNRAEERKRKIQNEIDELTRAKYALLEETNRLRQSQAPAPTAGGPTPAAARPAEPSAKPTVDQFSTYEEYVEALTDWKAGEKVRQALDSERERAGRESAQQQAQQALAKFHERAADLKAQHPDFDQVLALPLTPAMQHVVLHDEQGPALAYHLLTHPDVHQRLLAAPDHLVFYELGQVRAALSAPKAPAPPAKPITTAPTPITPVAGSSSAALGTFDPSKSNSLAEWRSHRKEYAGQR